MKAIGLLVCVFTIGLSATEKRQWIDDGEAIFFPKKFGETLSVLKNSRNTWWNFLVVDAAEIKTSETALRELCQTLPAEGLVDRLECGNSLKEYLPLLREWARDLPLREKAPTPQGFRKRLQATLTKASFPLPRELLTILRSDPMESYVALQERAQSRLPINFPRQNGFFFDAQSQRWILPFRPSFAPHDAKLTTKLMERLNQALPKLNWSVVGPHGSAFENRDQILKDLERVSAIGTLLLLLFAAAVIYLKRYRLLWAIPMVAVGVGAATVVIILCFGSIHGIVLSFGAGIIGLTLDYSTLASFNWAKKRVWRTILVGMLTTLAALVVLSFSQIPLLSQLGIFSMVGLVASYLFIVILHRFYSPKLLSVPFTVRAPRSRFTFGLAIVMLCGLFLAPPFLRPSYDMNQFNFQSIRTRTLYEWLGPHLKSDRPLFEILPASLPLLHERLNWAKSVGIDLETPGFYLPPLAKQEKNLAGWKTLLCGAGKIPLSSEESLFFEPFFSAFSCQATKPRGLESPPPLYVADLKGSNQWLSIWFPKNEAEKTKIEERYPQSTSLRAIVNLFPVTLSRELFWMFPLSLLLILLIHFFHYRAWRPSFAALSPFAVGMGLVVWAVFLGMPFSFMSLVGVMILLGLGVDYGIFAVDHAIEQSQDSAAVRDSELTSTLLVAALTTIAGYLPLVVCGHQVLAHLGQVLTLGISGAILGAFWLAPALVKKLK